ncbi:ABC transporter substrate-binding protein [Corticibacter populi]|uniref:ABC transporter substrate-binding protein n=1 Tax=Corticibacter populi TaxID=1550736 RepID=A0A3M6QZA8_9BURK|nr:transporter substrate-binding domain-containing protein [Corticibacter populi]RMX08366.1 ABC transporter substrate-binding protein [Corticibacter populi]RZS35660.1 arginine/ornithine transport system substrate-binding protein [Corticibacter populi]
MKKNTLAAMLAVSLTAFAGAAVAQDLRVAVDPTYEPFVYKNSNGQLVGFNIDFSNAVCEALARKCVFVEQVWDSMIPGLQSRKYDVIISDMSITEERKKVVDFTDRYYKTPGTIVVKKSLDYKDHDSLKGLTLGVLKGSTHERYAEGELAPKGVKVVAYEAQDQVYLDINAGRLDGTVADKVEVTGGFLGKPEGADFHAVGPDLLEPKYFGEGMGIALRKGQPELKEQLNATIKKLREDGQYAEIAKKYFDFDPYGQD